MTTKQKIYLDHNATTPVDARVLQCMLPYFSEIYGNAASIDHDFGYDAKAAVDKAREQIAKAINASPEEIIFTSGATESNNIALFGIAERYKEVGNHIITSVTEHKAILDCCKRLESDGFTITYLNVNQYGEISLDELVQAITPKTILVSIMAANNEIGTLSPLDEIGKITRSRGVLFHSDASQAIGNIPIDVQRMNIDVLSLSGHKIYGPKGIGVLYRRKSNPRVNLSPIIYGGGHEKGLRSGTLNVPAIVGIGKAIELGIKEMAATNRRYKQFANYIWSELNKEIQGIQLNGHPVNRLANNLNISIPKIESKALIVQLKDVAISAGSACTSNSVEPSHVIKSLAYGDERAHTSIRIGIGKFNTLEDIQEAINKIIKAIKSIQVINNGLN